MADITPPLDVGLLMSSVERKWAPFQGVRLPLHARALVIETEGRRVAIVSLELLGLSEQAMGGMNRFRHAVIEASGGAVRVEDLVLTSTHAHSTPETMALSDLYQTAPFRSWVQAVAVQIGLAIRDGVERLRPCSLAVATTSAPELGIHRRIKTTRGVLLSHPEPPPEIVLSREGVVDHSVCVAIFRDGTGRVAAVVVNGACHPVHEMCCPYVSPDYPGVMSSLLERQYTGAHVLFLNGADGNVNPPVVSGGAGAAERHGRCLAEVVNSVLSEARPAQGVGMDLLWSPVELPARSPAGEEQTRPIRTQLAVLQVADAAFCFIPGEPFAETGLAIKAQSRFSSTFVVGYAEGSIGYIPTEEARREGGYETGPGAWSPLAPGSEPLVRRTAIDLLNRAHQSVTASAVSAVHDS